ncbi:MAG TPA: hypothetical protein PLU07_09300 [Ferruginibacter sp.]|nr:hypothetical protein [Ferruginibacter sp.]
MRKAKTKTMAEIKLEILDYLTEQLSINQQELNKYEADVLLPPTVPDIVKQMREQEAIKLRDRVSQISQHISAIKRITMQDGQPETNTEQQSTSGKQKRRKEA